MLTSYRELKQNKTHATNTTSTTDTTELDAHLEQCADCRQILAQHTVVGERIRLLPTLEAPADAHAKLMQRLATEHAHFLQHSSHTLPSSASAVPDFLKPYMNEQAQVVERNSSSLRAFSTAETGPLPIIHARRKKRIAPTGQFAVLALAASFMMIFLVGGLVSLLVLANHGVNSSNTTTSLQKQSLIAPLSYTTQTSYAHVASAVATPDHIYYSAYGDDETQWMVEEVSSTAKNAVSVPLLETSNQSPLFVLAASSQWVIWLQFDQPQNKIQHHTSTSQFTRTWSLNALSLASTEDGQQFGNVVTLEHGTFDTEKVPDWVHTPIQGISFMQDNTLLVASIGTKGDAQLLRYQLDSNGGTTSTSIATATNGHILTSPSATADGTRMFWSEEWFTDEQQPHSTLWTQELTKGTVREKGAWRPTIEINKHVYGSSETLFHPVVINDTLFVLSTSDTPVSTPGTPGATSTPTVQTTAKPVSIAPVTSRFTDLYPVQVDEAIHGTVLAISLDDATAQPTALSNDSTAAALQSGTRFILWQSSSGYQMYDALAGSSVTVGDSIKGASFLAVNGDSAIWMMGTANTATTPNTTGVQTATFDMFNWRPSFK